MKMYSWTGSVDPDESYWVESGKSGKSFLNIIRLFYEGAPPAHEQIGTFLSLLFIYLFISTLQALHNVSFIAHWHCE